MFRIISFLRQGPLPITEAGKAIVTSSCQECLSKETKKQSPGEKGIYDFDNICGHRGRKYVSNGIKILYPRRGIS
jgi:hypothetical protein